jgi:hypothetical protein
MKTVFSNSELAHVWAQQSQEAGRGSNFFFEGTSIFSWGHHFKIAEFITAPNGETVVLYNPSRCSSSTGKHQHSVRRAVPDYYRNFDCACGKWGDWDYNREVANRVKEIKETIAKIPRSRTYGESLLSRAIGQIEALREFAFFFVLDLPAIVSTWDIDNLVSPEILAKLQAKKQARIFAEEHAEEIRAEKLKANLPKWLNGEINSIDSDQIYIRLKGNMVETSLGAQVSIKEAEVLYKAIVTGKPVHGLKIGYYNVISWDGTNLKIGCHDINLSEVNRFAGLMRWN